MKYIPFTDPVLSWKKNFNDYRYLVQNHIARVAIYFQDFINLNYFFSSDIKEAWAQLSLEKQVDLFTDPDAAEIIFLAKENVSLALACRLNFQLEDLMATLLLRNNSKYRHSRSLSWASHQQMQTYNGIVLDTFGMLHCIGSERIQSPTRKQTHFYCQQIEKALQIIFDVSPEAFSLVENFTTTIHLRQNPYHPNYCSWSTHMGVGKITASNFHYVAAEVVEVVDFLIHESIHNFLHLVEEEYGPFLEEKAYASSWIR